MLSHYYKTTADYIIGGYVYSEQETQMLLRAMLVQKWDVVERLMGEIKELTL